MSVFGSVAPIESLGSAVAEGGVDLGPLLASEMIVRYLLLATAAVGVPVAARLLRFLAPRSAPVAGVPWNLGHALFLVLVAFTVLVVAGLVAQREFTPLEALQVTVLALGAPAAVAVGLAVKSAPEGTRALGLARHGNGRAVVGGVLAYAAVLPAWVGLAAVWPVLAAAFGMEVPMQDVLEGILGLHGSDLLQAVVVAVVVAPLLEETLFRGFLQPLFVRHLGAGWGIAITSFLFAILHGAAYMPPLFVLGFVLGVVRHRTSRLSAAWAVHAVHNGWTLLLTLGFPELLERLTT